MPGLFYEDFEVGAVLRHELRRTVTESDNVLFSTMTLNPQPLHIDEEFSRRTEHGQRPVNSIFTLGLVVGMSVTDTTLGTTIANLGFEGVTFPEPVFHGDTIRAETEIAAKRESRSRVDAGIVWFSHTGFNQRNGVVCHCRRAGLVLKRPV